MPTLEQIQAKLKKLQAQADTLIARKAQVAVNQIRELMLKHGLTTADIEAKAQAKRAAHALNGHAAGAKAKAAGAGKSIPKYRNNKTGATWTGHGRAPAWIAAVKDRTQFLIEGASELKPAANAAVTRAKAGSKGQPKGAQPPKYLDPKTGATWSGRGPAPAWLATVKDRTRFLIDSAAASNVAAGKVVTAKKAVASKTAARKGTAATKKAAAKKSAAKPAVKKATAKKAAVKKTAAAKKVPGRKTVSKGNAGATSAAAAPQTSTVQAGA
ncbi:nucleoid-structuring protein H-NS [Paraburkholderia phytofirmans OLGA172]|uniref:Nucleoid-structuring protein H-NS n=1 Tax=Paraburkholderia phytofirmans OLGA172 TaxID=1417228 RepID=A0A160FU03_9BURK|nr:H-NS family nucleoid-associated regulatory protein [Paraburkholderia phytofirmans]ANB76705.1 nucleoid-structuring protein H-NS [Paraburkholderia phytofirmans OLGA172]